MSHLDNFFMGTTICLTYLLIGGAWLSSFVGSIIKDRNPYSFGPFAFTRWISYRIADLSSPELIGATTTFIIFWGIIAAIDIPITCFWLFAFSCAKFMKFVNSLQ